MISASDSVRMAAVYPTGWMPTPELSASVAAAINDVRTRGDAAIVAYMRTLDDGQYDLAKLRVPIPMHEGARALVPPEIMDALALGKERLTRVFERQRHADSSFTAEDGTRYGTRFRALDSVAICIPPGASATAVLMGAVPAKIAGVDRVVLLAPPDGTGHVHPSVVGAASICDIDELYAVGGAHGVAAAAFGTESIGPVQKIVGSPNPTVVEAKRQVFGICGIDGLGGAPEVLVVADDGANSEYVTWELLAQAERDPHARVGVVSESRSLLDAVAQLVDTLDIGTLPRGETMLEVMAHRCFLIHAESRTDVLRAVDAFSPERVSLQVRDPEPYLARIRRAGTVYVGDMTPAAFGEYLSGTTNMLPANGGVRYASGLTLDEFVRQFNVVENSRERMLRDAQLLAAIAEYEGLPQHAQTARMRSGL